MGINKNLRDLINKIEPGSNVDEFVHMNVVGGGFCGFHAIGIAADIIDLGSRTMFLSSYEGNPIIEESSFLIGRQQF
jgi:hypothetical protein